MRIFLTGFMGSGKSFTGQRLARATGRPFVDLDDWIEARSGRTVADIFAHEGEAAFRDLETAALRGFDRTDYLVVATGGGTPCFHGNMDWMSAHGLTVFIDPTVEVLYTRLRSEYAKRPLLGNGQQLRRRIEEKLAERRECYEAATLHLRPRDQNPDVTRLILDHLGRNSPI